MNEMERLQKQIELMIAVNYELKAHVWTLHQLLGETVDQLGCSPERFRSVFEQNRNRYHQQLLAQVEDTHPALASRIDFRPPEAVPGLDVPDSLFP